MIRRERARWDALFIGLALVGAALAKEWYRCARADALDWMLAPTVRLVEAMSGFVFERETGLGYVSRTADFVVVPACAGINFFLVALVSSLVAHIGDRESLREKIRFVVLAGLGSYAVTLVANSVRIVVAIDLLRGRIAWGWFTPGRLHEAEGVVVYLVALLVLSAVLTRGSRRVSVGVAS